MVDDFGTLRKFIVRGSVASDSHAHAKVLLGGVDLQLGTLQFEKLIGPGSTALPVGEQRPPRRKHTMEMLAGGARTTCRPDLL